MRQNIEDRFWSWVDKSGGEDACWQWKGYRDKKGYGRFTIVKGKVTRAHRFAFKLIHGDVKSDIFACHECDNPPCCNPKHLFPGTVLDNNLDMVKKGRSPMIANQCFERRGEANSNCKLSDRQVQEIRERRSNGERAALLAQEYGVARSLVVRIVSGTHRFIN